MLAEHGIHLASFLTALPGESVPFLLGKRRSVAAALWTHVVLVRACAHCVSTVVVNHATRDRVTHGFSVGLLLTTCEDAIVVEAIIPASMTKMGWVVATGMRIKFRPGLVVPSLDSCDGHLNANQDDDADWYWRRAGC